MFRINHVDVYSKALVVLASVIVLMAVDLPATGENYYARYNGSVIFSEAGNGLPDSIECISVKLADLNNDGNLDLVTTSDGDGIWVYLGNGGSNWTMSARLGENGGFNCVDSGDFDKDGKTDLVACSPGGYSTSPKGLHFFKGDGAGGFSNIPNTGLPDTGFFCAVCAFDMNRDGNLDIIATNGYLTETGVKVYVGDGTGKFMENSAGLPGDEDRDSRIAISDFNKDGSPDIAVGGMAGMDIFLGNGGSGGGLNWSRSSSGLPDVPPESVIRFTGIASNDIDRDGLDDLVLASYGALAFGKGQGLRAYRNVNNAASWENYSRGLPEWGDFLDVATADFNLDGYPDIVAGGYSENPKDGIRGIQVYLGSEEGIWLRYEKGLPNSSSYIGVDTGDVNGDGRPDIAIARYFKTSAGDGKGGIEVWLNTPEGFVDNYEPEKLPENTPLSPLLFVPIAALALVFVAIIYCWRKR
jgi:hypothetical protein